MPLEDSSPWLCGLALAIPTAMILASLAVARRYVRGTTLVAPWCWAIVAVALVAAVDGAALLSGSGMTPAWLSAARYLAAIATFCPLMAVLGAKRPQDRAWQLIVLALWFVLALPALQDVIYHYGRPVALDPAWRGFVTLLILVGLVNYLPTRFGVASLLYAAAQAVLLAEYLPLGETIVAATTWRVPLALALFAGACLSPLLGWPRQNKSAPPSARLWRDFRDAYGLLWAVRLGQRAEETASTRGGATVDEEGLRRASEQTFIAHLQRFVSRQWIDERLGA